MEKMKKGGQEKEKEMDTHHGSPEVATGFGRDPRHFFLS